MGFHQALNFAKLIRRESHTARNGHVMQPKFRSGSALVDMDVRRLIGFMAVKVEPKSLNS